MNIEEALFKLGKSKFRSRFHLDAADREYIRKVGMDKLRLHAADFVRTKLAPAEPENDGKQTPMRGHPVFKAMHGCAMCCRSCLNKWYQVALHRELTAAQQEKIVNFLLAWVEKELKNF